MCVSRITGITSKVRTMSSHYTQPLTACTGLRVGARRFAQPTFTSSIVSLRNLPGDIVFLGQGENGPHDVRMAKRAS